MYHSVEMGDTLRRSSTAIPQIAAQKLCRIRAEFLRISSDYVKFLVTSTVCYIWQNLKWDAIISLASLAGAGRSAIIHLWSG